MQTIRDKDGLALSSRNKLIQEKKHVLKISFLL